MPRSLGKSVPYALALVLGLIAGLFLCQLQSCRFIPHITLGQALQTVALLLIFVTAHRYYEKAHDRRRKKIEILVNMIGGILTRVEESHTVFLRCADHAVLPEFMRFRLDSALREYSNTVRALEDVLEQSGHQGDASGLLKVKDDRVAYKDLVTETPYPKRLPSDRIAQESKLYSKIRSNLVSLQLEIAELD